MLVKSLEATRQKGLQSRMLPRLTLRHVHIHLIDVETDWYKREHDQLQSSLALTFLEESIVEDCDGVRDEQTRLEQVK